jgi:formylglycine-generating enzyme required for sulfatase activity
MEQPRSERGRPADARYPPTVPERPSELAGQLSAQGAAPAPDMAWVPGGGFLMGSKDFYPEESSRSTRSTWMGFGWTSTR